MRKKKQKKTRKKSSEIVDRKLEKKQEKTPKIWITERNKKTKQKKQRKYLFSLFIRYDRECDRLLRTGSFFSLLLSTDDDGGPFATGTTWTSVKSLVAPFTIIQLYLNLELQKNAAMKLNSTLLRTYSPERFIIDQQASDISYLRHEFAS